MEAIWWELGRIRVADLRREAEQARRVRTARRAATAARPAPQTGSPAYCRRAAVAGRS